MLGLKIRNTRHVRQGTLRENRCKVRSELGVYWLKTRRGTWRRMNERMNERGNMDRIWMYKTKQEKNRGKTRGYGRRLEKWEDEKKGGDEEDKVNMRYRETEKKKRRIAEEVLTDREHWSEFKVELTRVHRAHYSRGPRRYDPARCQTFKIHITVYVCVRVCV